jgi:imidazolonepropionase-like amidohydrolase
MSKVGRTFGVALVTSTVLTFGAALMLACVACQAADGSITAIVGATVIHPERDLPSAVAPDSTLIIAGRRIESIGPASSARVPAGATLIDGKGKWVVPGLIDSHVHFFQSGNLYTRPDAADFNAWMPYAKEVERNKARLPATFKVWLASGVTGVVDIGGPFWNFEVRDAAAKSPAAPRVAVAGPLLSMIDRVKLDLGDPPIIKIASADEARALVRRELQRKPDFIKVWFIHRQGDDLGAQAAIVKAAADAAHAAGVRLAVHATELIVAKASLRAGADFLVHSVEDEPVDEEFLALAKRNHALYCPTLFVTLGYRYALSNTWQPTEAERRLADPQILAAMNDLRNIPSEMLPERVAKAMHQPAPPRPSPIALQNLRKVWDAGIPVAMGTDAGNIGTLHGPSVFREMEIMTQAGLTPLQVLRSATSNGAKAMGMESETGTLAPGRLADLVILDADPLANVLNLSRIHRVIKDGEVFVPDELIRSLPR